LVKYGKEPHFTQVRNQIDMQNRSLLQIIIRSAGVKTAAEMKEILEKIKTLKNIPLVPQKVEPIVETPVIVEVKAIEEPKVEEPKETVLVEEPKETVLVEENKEETKEFAKVTEQVNPSTIITADAAPEEQNQENLVKDEKHEVHFNSEGDSVDKECDKDCQDTKVEVVQEQNNDQEAPMNIADEEESKSRKSDTPPVESPLYRKESVITNQESNKKDNNPIEPVTTEEESAVVKPEDD